MVPSKAASAFRQFLRDHGIDIDTAALDEIVGAMLDFYARVPASGLAATEGDMLLFQFGVHDRGDGEHFEFNITRQFITDGEDGDMSQLRCTVYYEPTTTLRAIGSGNRWCGSPDGLPEFKSFIFCE
jgi:hypothetical protein